MISWHCCFESSHTFLSSLLAAVVLLPARIPVFPDTDPQIYYISSGSQLIPVIHDVDDALNNILV